MEEIFNVIVLFIIKVEVTIFQMVVLIILFILKQNEQEKEKIFAIDN